ncbi:hypothetical protein [Streptomyces alkaliterrae]|uniref:Uncharacterized protein n=1 Tax=Streptomyces alkaliterrae TaxID=2213162 RepID=A0A5P0YV05_9ACTN|nr:hypothetical protein [Streptomyces alkaliterrae]MBB1256455.1 hypothetical protein [Streptomyces alkaliterrae]MBB1257685.1 hypothetical protein [Streptomyces alkaliterrae]MQS04128.1 hypothetical protein [Streptomyces alkaliterrae]
MTRSTFTVEVSGTSGSHAGLWPEGECFMILPDGEHRAENALARIRLVKPGGPLESDAAVSRLSGPPPDAGPTTVTEVERRAELLAAQFEEHPVLVLHDPDKRLLCSVHPEPLAKGEPRHFAVLDEQGAPLCHLARGRSPLTRRAFWRIDPADGGPSLTGHKGTVAGWLGFALLLPVWALFFVVSLVITLVTLGNTLELIVWGCPRRIVWRRSGSPRAALDFRYLRSNYSWCETLLDRRVAYAQAALHQFGKYRAG